MAPESVAEVAGGAIIVLGAAIILFSQITWFPLALVTLVIVGMFQMFFLASTATMLQLIVPDELRGRVISVYTTVFAGSTPIGGLFAGFLASRWGAVAALAVGGALTVAVGLAAIAWLRRHRLVGMGPAAAH